MKPVPASTALEIVAVIAGLVAAVLAAVTAAAGTAAVPPIVAMVDRYACLPVSHVVTELVKKEKFVEAMASLALLRKPVDNFFENVKVNVEDLEIRNNRLCLCIEPRCYFRK